MVLSVRRVRRCLLDAALTSLSRCRSARVEAASTWASEDCAADSRPNSSGTR